MYIVDNRAANFGNFKLDIGDIGMRSISGTDIKLPYTGALPVQMSAVSDTYIYLNIQLAQGVRIVLAAYENGKAIKYPLKASNEEIISLLDSFFEQKYETTGIAQYWLGIWQAHYIEWKKIVTDPNRLLTILSALPINDRMYLRNHMMDIPTTE